MHHACVCVAFMQSGLSFLLANNVPEIRWINTEVERLN